MSLSVTLAQPFDHVQQVREISERGDEDQGQSESDVRVFFYSFGTMLMLSPGEQLAPPKSKYIDHILVATHTGEAGVAEIFRTLHLRLRDSTWTVVFKALIVTHLMVREGQVNATLQYMAENPKKLAISGYSEGGLGNLDVR